MDILLILNAQNSFLDRTGSVYLGDKAEIFKVRLKDYLKECGVKRIFFREKHGLQDDFFTRDQTHSIVTTNDFQIPEDLIQYADIIYDKTRYNALYNTGIEDYLKREKIKTVGLCGIETHTSILFTAEDLRNRGYQVEVIEPLAVSRSEHLHSYAILLMGDFLGVRIES